MSFVVNPFSSMIGRKFTKVTQIQHRQPEKEARAEIMRIYTEEGTIFRLLDKLKDDEKKGNVKVINNTLMGIENWIKREVGGVRVLGRSYYLICDGLVEHVVELINDVNKLKKRGFSQEMSQEILKRSRTDLITLSRELDQIGDYLKGLASSVKSA